jgi:trehalose synthase
VGAERTADLWWKHAVIYCLDVETFVDSDGDGHGDFDGLLSRIDYLSSLGVSVLWLLPFFPSPNRDDGYDITAYDAVDQRLGTLGQFVEVIRTAKDRGMRVIIDLVLNHTSDQHPWFQAALEDPSSKYRQYYVWSDEPRDDLFDMVIFPDQEDSNWEYHEPTGQYYLHRFYKHQPDLNISNPLVRDALAEVVGFWLQLGVDGFRIDAVPYLIETSGIADRPDGGGDEWHELLRDLRRFIWRRSEGAAMLGEVNLPAEEAVEYFGGGGDELNLIFGFDVNQAMWLSLARGDAGPIRAALDELPEVSDEVHWANFARLHDEANVGRLTEGERAEVFDAFGPSEDMQIFDRGLRRRLAPMLDGDPARIRMVLSLVLSLPGSAVLYYGEEIGMGENLGLEGRLAVRSTMQWSDRPDGGFGPSEGTPSRRCPPDGDYGPEQVNVASQRADPDSLLNWLSGAVRTRRQIPELGAGRWSVLTADDDAVLAHCCEMEESCFVAVHSFADDERRVTVEVDAAESLFVVLAANGATAEQRRGQLIADLPAHGYLWLQTDQPLQGHTSALPRT